MATIDTRPEVVNVNHLAGNTLTLKVKTPVMYTAGLVWLAQVRATSISADIDATFDVMLGTSPDPEVAVTYLTLPSATTAMLCNDLGVITTVREKGSTTENTIKRYTGRYDIQVSAPGGADPVITVGTGELIIDLDISRTA